MEPIKKEKVRVGILVDGFSIPYWIYLIIEKISNGDYATPVLIVKKNAPLSQPKESRLKKIKKNLRYICYMMYRKLEDKKFRPLPNAFALKDLSSLLPGVPVLEVTPIQKKFSDIIEQADIDKINEYNVDVFLRFGFRILRGAILRSAKLGIWSYHHGDNRVNRGGAAGIWEAIEGWRETGFILQILTENLDGGLVLYRSWSQKEISINRNLHNLYWKAMPVMPMKLKELYHAGKDEFIQKASLENRDLSFYSNPLYTVPTNSQLARRLFNQYSKWIRYKWWLLFHFKQWILLYCFDSEEKIATSIFRFKKLVPPKDRFWADPCLIYKDGKYYIFFEELIYKQNDRKAHISVIEMDQKGNYGQPAIALKCNCHLSYPFVFDYKGTCYMVPETMGNGTIELYRSVLFPDKWEHVMNLKENIKAVDNTFFEKDGKVWMFSYVQEDKDIPVFELFLYYADELITTEWTSHPQNPVITDIKSARPGGRLFIYNEKLYRPSQDCSFTYGYATVINEIVRMDAESYIEKPVSNILPNWSKEVFATHTLSHQKNLTVIDAYFKRRK